jgi:hypothetical protein
MVFPLSLPTLSPQKMDWIPFLHTFKQIFSSEHLNEIEKLNRRILSPYVLFITKKQDTTYAATLLHTVQPGDLLLRDLGYFSLDGLKSTHKQGSRLLCSKGRSMKFAVNLILGILDMSPYITRS